MLAVDFTDVIIQMANFLILIFLLNIIVYRPIRRVMNERKADMASQEDETLNWHQKADRFSMELEENITETRKNGFKEREDLKNEGIIKEKELLQDAYSSVEEKINRTKEEIGEKIRQVRESLQGEVDGFSRELAEKILGRGV